VVLCSKFSLYQKCEKSTLIPHHLSIILYCVGKVRTRIKTGAVASVGATHLRSVPPISCLASLLLHTSNIVFKECGPLVVFGPPCCEILATGLIKTSVRKKNYQQKQFSNEKVGFQPTLCAILSTGKVNQCDVVLTFRINFPHLLEQF